MTPRKVSKKTKDEISVPLRSLGFRESYCESKRRTSKKESREVIKELKDKKSLTEMIKRKVEVVVGISEVQKLSAATIGAAVLNAAKKSKKMLGMHVSASGSLEQSVYNAVAMGCRSFGLFVRNQRTWNCPSICDEAVERFKEAVEQYSYPPNLIIPHGSYLINPGSCDPEKLEKSRAAMLDECERCEKLGITLYNFHPGSTAGLCTKEKSIRTVADTVNYIIGKTSFVVLVLETMAGQGNTIGGTFEELRQIIDLVNEQSRLGICIDTCHLFAAGYDIRTKEAYQETMRKFDDTIGFKFLKGLHINDSKGDLGCHLDRHVNIGHGKITMEGFANFINDPRLDGLPMILETPSGSADKELIRLYKTAL